MTEQKGNKRKTIPERTNTKGAFFYGPGIEPALDALEKAHTLQEYAAKLPKGRPIDTTTALEILSTIQDRLAQYWQTYHDLPTKIELPREYINAIADSLDYEKTDYPDNEDNHGYHVTTEHGTIPIVEYRSTALNRVSVGYLWYSRDNIQAGTLVFPLPDIPETVPIPEPVPGNFLDEFHRREYPNLTAALDLWKNLRGIIDALNECAENGEINLADWIGGNVAHLEDLAMIGFDVEKPLAQLNRVAQYYRTKGVF